MTDARAYWDTEITRDQGWMVTPERLDDWLVAVMPHIGPGLMPGKRCLDLGCGTGRLLAPIARLCPEAHFIGVDVSPVALLAAREVCGPNVSLVLADGGMLPKVGPLDAAWSVLTFQHLPPVTLRSYLNDLSYLLIPGAPFRFQFVRYEDDVAPQHSAEWSWGHPTNWMCERLFAFDLDVREIDHDRLHPGWTWMRAACI